MNIDILGSSGGVGGQSGSTSLLISNRILVDAGSGLGALSLERMRGIEAVFITHSHMDHISALPPFLANLFGHRTTPLPIYALPETIEVLKSCIFNGQIWPDFTAIPSAADPIIEFRALTPWQTLRHNELSLTPFSVEHTVPTVGYSIQDQNQHFVFCADSKSSAEFIDQLNRLPAIHTLMIECSFPDRYQQLADMSGHLTPQTLYNTVQKLLQAPQQVWITHLKPAYEDELRALFSQDTRFNNWRVL
ncbi:3',5'-cyclic-nucleotide phosphodiesterase [Aliidiomarina celeris]|uniref:3',5'-cyclic-nucleotide phosphodiesterase n=1 Tax=Aliidiomarina celeris TaxID=2249428 RepID=UPI000DEBBE7E|nr:3',5'-cyclic-nucleotide phosphodiesterase [Aliidiomarina celeris]